MRNTSEECVQSESVIPPGTVCLEDYQRHAKEKLSHEVYEYIASGCADEATMIENALSFKAWNIVPRVLTDCTKGTTCLKLLGETFRHPVFLAPVAHQKLVHSEGELATAEAAAVLETGMICSTLSSVTLEDIAQQLPSKKWFQLYFNQNREFTLELVRRAEAAGYTALVLTIDAPVNGARNRIQRAGFSMPDAIKAANLVNQPLAVQKALEPHESVIFQGLMSEAPNWQDIQWLRNATELPILLKGVLHPSDARKCIALGLQGVVVSNHGGRCLDTVPAAITMLPAIREAVGGEAIVLLDGGIRRGSDVFKALALGADAVAIGRPQVFALAVAGALGVAHMLRLLREELEITMALAGCPTLNDIGPAALLQRL